MSDFDLIVIGGGPGGYAAAIRTALRNAKVALIERAALGGVCLNTGCIPTKTMVAAAELMRRVRHTADFRLDAVNVAISPGALFDRRREIVHRLGVGLGQLIKHRGITLLHGTAQLQGQKRVAVAKPTGEVVTISAPRIVLATGSRPAPLPGVHCDGLKILDSEQVLGLQEVPARLLIVGGGYIGCEYASIFQSFGAQVTVIEALDRLLPQMDAELSHGLERAFRKQNIHVSMKTRLASVKADAEVVVTLEDGSKLIADKVLVCVGRVPNTETIGLAAEQIVMDGAFIAVDDRLRTSAPGIFALGDMTGKSMLAHAAYAQARVAIENAFDPKSKARMHYDAIPAAVFSHPEIGTVGLTVEEAHERGIETVVGHFPLVALPKAAAVGEIEGFIKIVADAKTQRVLGVHVLGGQASEILAAAAVAVSLKATLEQLSDTIFAHPTFGEALGEVAASALGQSLHHAVRKKP
jgi:dihydrolipoamide dehydrogenase